MFQTLGPTPLPKVVNFSVLGILLWTVYQLDSWLAWSTSVTFPHFADVLAPVAALLLPTALLLRLWQSENRFVAACQNALLGMWALGSPFAFGAIVCVVVLVNFLLSFCPPLAVFAVGLFLGGWVKVADHYLKWRDANRERAKHLAPASSVIPTVKHPNRYASAAVLFAGLFVWRYFNMPHGMIIEPNPEPMDYLFAIGMATLIMGGLQTVFFFGFVGLIIPHDPADNN